MATIIATKDKAAEHTIFVYGTLRYGFGNNERMLAGRDDVRFLAAGETQEKFAMYAAGIPYVTKQEQVSNIVGEVYVVSDAVLAELDEMESHPSWYKREETQIVMDNGVTAPAWLYFNETPAGSLIQSGDFENRLDK